MSDEMASPCRRRRSCRTSPLEDDDLLGEILVRLPPQPSSLPRASLVCKPWRRLATDGTFLRLFRAHHRKPPVLGAFEKRAGELVFTSVLGPPDLIPRERFSLRICGDDRFASDHWFWSVLGCRHGRVLIINWTRRVVLVFHPVSGDLRSIAISPEFVADGVTANGAVLCAAGDNQDNVYGDRHLSPFKVVLVGTGRQQPAFARVYSSETGGWGDLISMVEPCTRNVSHPPCTLIGNAIYWWLSGPGVGILQFDLDNQSIAVINGPPLSDFHRGSRIIRAEDGGVGVVTMLHPTFTQMWGCKVNSHGVATWLLRKTVNMGDILDLQSSIGAEPVSVDIVGYSEEAEAVFMSVHGYPYGTVFIVQLDSMQFIKSFGRLEANVYHPFTNFYPAGTVRSA